MERRGAEILAGRVVPGGTVQATVYPLCPHKRHVHVFVDEYYACHRGELARVLQALQEVCDWPRAALHNGILFALAFETPVIFIQRQAILNEADEELRLALAFCLGDLYVPTELRVRSVGVLGRLRPLDATVQIAGEAWTWWADDSCQSPPSRVLQW